MAYFVFRSCEPTFPWVADTPPLGYLNAQNADSYHSARYSGAGCCKGQGKGGRAAGTDQSGTPENAKGRQGTTEGGSADRRHCDQRAGARLANGRHRLRGIWRSEGRSNRRPLTPQAPCSIVGMAQCPSRRFDHRAGRP